MMKAYRLGAIWDVGVLDDFGDRVAFTVGSAARRREVEKKRDRRSRDSARGTRRGRRPGKQKPLARLAMVQLKPLERNRLYER